MSSDLVVVMAHGLLRDRARHAGQAEAWAALGLSVVLVDQCDEGWDAAGFERYAHALNAAARAEGAARVVYAGFSAGGGVSRLAAQHDPRAVAWLGLDPVGVDAVPPSGMPQRALFAPAQGCNAGQRGLLLLAGDAPRIALEVRSATHCHFESPSDALCRALCGAAASEADDAALRERITVLAADYLLAVQSGKAADAGQWRTGDALRALPLPEARKRD